MNVKRGQAYVDNDPRRGNRIVVIDRVSPTHAYAQSTNGKDVRIRLDRLEKHYTLAKLERAMKTRKLVEFDKAQLWSIIEALDAKIAVESENAALGNHDTTVQERARDNKLRMRLEKHWRTLSE